MTTTTKGQGMGHAAVSNIAHAGRSLAFARTCHSPASVVLLRPARECVSDAGRERVHLINDDGAAQAKETKCVSSDATTSSKVGETNYRCAHHSQDQDQKSKHRTQSSNKTDPTSNTQTHQS